ncbi:unnamed protein product, partial [Mesorhabditis belari]|uniref:Cyclopropane-fatty-acyl-phospholipid synthase n=1 Tax=Mesorhabditis belari TaxID=2138241 RepID=A0AAF3F5B3_9BILA
MPMFSTIHLFSTKYIFLPFIVKFLNGIVGKSNETLDLIIPTLQFKKRFGGQKVDNNNEEFTEPITLLIENPIRFCFLMLLDPKLGLGEAFMDGHWRAEPGPTEFLKLLIRAKKIRNQEKDSKRRKTQMKILISKVFQLLLNVNFRKFWSIINYCQHKIRENTLLQSARNIKDHYDLGNDMFELFLDESMTYSCALFENAESQMDYNVDCLKEAQERKLDMLIDRLKLSENDHVLEIGCGWGSCAIRAVKRYGCKWTGLTISKEQLAWAQRKVQEAGLSHLIDLKYLDYRLEQGVYSKVISIEMIEAVGEKYLPEYFQVINDRLESGGKAVLQAIICPDSYYDRYCKSSDFIRKHIFPGGHLPSLNHIQRCLPDGVDLCEEITSIGLHYAKTLDYWLNAWCEKESQILDLNYSATFHRKWQFYFALCSSLFSYNHINVIQFSLQK